MLCILALKRSKKFSTFFLSKLLCLLWLHLHNKEESSQLFQACSSSYEKNIPCWIVCHLAVKGIGEQQKSTVAKHNPTLRLCWCSSPCASWRCFECVLKHTWNTEQVGSAGKETWSLVAGRGKYCTPLSIAGAGRGWHERSRGKEEAFLGRGWVEQVQIGPGTTGLMEASSPFF